MNELLLERVYIGRFVAVAICTVFILIVAVWCQKKNRSKWVKVAMLAEYVVLILCYTVLCRKMGTLTQFQPIPFYNFWNDSNPIGMVMVEGVLNMLLFLPMGIIMAWMGERWKWMLGGALLLSVTIEVMQWLTKSGCCETNDVINNCIGSVVGYYAVYKKGELWKEKTNRDC